MFMPAASHPDFGCHQMAATRFIIKAIVKPGFGRGRGFIFARKTCSKPPACHCLQCYHHRFDFYIGWYPPVEFLARPIRRRVCLAVSDRLCGLYGARGCAFIHRLWALGESVLSEKDPAGRKEYTGGQP